MLRCFVTGRSTRAGPGHPGLRDVIGGWLVEFLVLAAEVKGGAFFRKTQKNLADLKRQLDKVRLVITRELSVVIEGAEQPLPVGLNGRMVRDDPQFPALLVERAESESIGSLLCRISESLAHLVNRQLANAFEAAALRLMAVLGSAGKEWPNPSDEDQAEALGVTVERVMATRKETVADPMHVLFMARPLAIALGVEAIHLAHIIAADEQVSEVSLRSILEPVATKLSIDVEFLIERLRSFASLNDLLAEPFRIPIAALNGALKALGDPYQGVSNEDIHQRHFEAYKRQHAARILDLLRDRFVDAFDRGEGLSAYVALATLDSLQPDIAWFETKDELSDDDMNEQVQLWLRASGLSVDACSGPSRLASIEDVRERNREGLRQFSERFQDPIRLWTHRYGGASGISDPWWLAHSVKGSLLAIAARDGWADFRDLDNASIASWLKQSNDWPVNMPASSDLALLGFSADDLDKVRQKSKEDAELRRLARGRLLFAGKEISALESDYHQIVSSVRSLGGRFTRSLGKRKSDH